MHFYKYHGTGNDFVIVDNRAAQYEQLTTQKINQICHRRFGVGADGFMLLNDKPGYDFEMVYYNADGGEGSMCGNGGRCIAMFAHDMGINKTHLKFLAVDGEHLATVDNDLVALKMIDVPHIEPLNDHWVLNTGSPHYVKEVSNLSELDVYNEGRKIRYNDVYRQEGINVNFVQPVSEGALKVRTYERGVEDETFSCGTGVTAAALVFYINETGQNSIDVEVPGGKLNITYCRNADGSYNDIWLKGPAVKVFEGSLSI